MNRELLTIFQEVMEAEEVARGMNVEATCRLLAERAKGIPGFAYADAMDQFEKIYLDQFIHTCMAIPEFAADVRAGMALFR